MVFRYLRTLEGVSPPLSLTHLSCQTTAKAFVATCTSPFLRILFIHMPLLTCPSLRLPVELRPQLMN